MNAANRDEGWTDSERAILRQLAFEGDILARTWLRREGWAVVLNAQIESIIAGQRTSKVKLHRYLDWDDDPPLRWVAVYTKSYVTWHLNSRTHQHGIRTRHYDACRQLEADSGIPGWLCIVELETKMLLLAPFADLREHHPARCHAAGESERDEWHTFFRRDDFPVWIRDLPLRPPPPMPPKNFRALYGDCPPPPRSRPAVQGVLL